MAEQDSEGPFLDSKLGVHAVKTSWQASVGSWGRQTWLGGQRPFGGGGHLQQRREIEQDSPRPFATRPQPNSHL